MTHADRTGVVLATAVQAVPRGGAHKKQSVIGGKAAFLCQIAASGFSVLAQLFLARFLGAAQFGRYSVATNLAQLAAVPADGGSSLAVPRVLPEHRAKAQQAEVFGAARTALQVSALGGVAFGAALFGLGSAVNLGVDGRGTLAAAALCVPLFALGLVQMNLLRALDRVWSALLPFLVLQPAGLLVVAVIGRGRLDAFDVTVATAVVLLAVVVLNQVSLTVLRQRAGWPKPAYQRRRWARLSLPLLAVNMLQLIFQRLDVALVGILLDPIAAGVYALSNRFAYMTSLMANSYGNMAAPQISRAHWAGNRAKALRILTSIRVVTSIPAVGLLLVFLIGGHWILGYFGPNFATGYAALCVYAAGQTASVLFGPIGFLALVSGQSRAMIRANLVSGALTLAGYLVLIPTIGMVGAALANAVGVLVKNVIIAWALRREGYDVFRIRPLAPPLEGST